MIENDQLWWILTDYDRFWPIMIDTDRYWPIMIDFDRLWSILTDVYHGSDLIKNRKVRIINLPLRKYGHYPISRGLQSFAASADKLGCVSTASEGFLSSSLTIIIKAAVLNERSRTRTNKKKWWIECHCNFSWLFVTMRFAQKRMVQEKLPRTLQCVFYHKKSVLLRSVISIKETLN